MSFGYIPEYYRIHIGRNITRDIKYDLTLGTEKIYCWNSSDLKRASQLHRGYITKRRLESLIGSCFNLSGYEIGIDIIRDFGIREGTLLHSLAPRSAIPPEISQHRLVGIRR
jgi:hypothetical protein